MAKFTVKHRFITIFTIQKKFFLPASKALIFSVLSLKEGRLDFFGGAGVGKTILLTEVIHNIIQLSPTGSGQKTLSGFCRNW